MKESPLPLQEQKIEKHPDIIAWEEYKESNPDSFKVSTITHELYLENRIYLAFLAGIQHAEKQLNSQKP